ncbi:MAG TPA: hypothetical protein VEX86_00125 [Longimicrobium sp.]|nr:hypothetical protein [Longimicrobium sp.]
MTLPIVQLVDSVAWEDAMGEGTLRRVEVRQGARVDTIPGVLTEEPPTLVAGPRLIGFGYEQGSITSVFEYDVRSRRLEQRPLPIDFHPYFSAPAFSPDGRHLAYVVVPGDGTGYAVARSWPDKALVWQSSTVEIPATDARGGSHGRWLSPDVAEVSFEIGSGTDTRWYRVHGSVLQRRVISADTVARQPGT